MAARASNNKLMHLALTIGVPQYRTERDYPSEARSVVGIVARAGRDERGSRLLQSNPVSRRRYLGDRRRCAGRISTVSAPAMPSGHGQHVSGVFPVLQVQPEEAELWFAP